MAINATRIKNLAAEYIQAEKRIEKLKSFIEDLTSGKATIYNITLARGNVLGNISDGIEPEYLNETYKDFITDGMQHEIKDNKELMDDLIEAIKKELQL